MQTSIANKIKTVLSFKHCRYYLLRKNVANLGNVWGKRVPWIKMHLVGQLITPKERRLQEL